MATQRSARSAPRPLVLAVGLDDWTAEELREELGELGQVLVTSDLHEACDAARFLRPTVIVIGDLASHLPVWACAREIRRAFGAACPPIVGVGDAPAASRRQAMINGAVWFGSLTRDMPRLHQIVRTFASRSSAAACA